MNALRADMPRCCIRCDNAPKLTSIKIFLFQLKLIVSCISKRIHCQPNIRDRTSTSTASTSTNTLSLTNLLWTCTWYFLLKYIRTLYFRSILRTRNFRVKSTKYYTEDPVSAEYSRQTPRQEKLFFGFKSRKIRKSTFFPLGLSHSYRLNNF